MVSDIPQAGGYVPVTPGVKPIDLRPFTPPPEMTEPTPRPEVEVRRPPEKEKEKESVKLEEINRDIESLNKLMEGLGNRLEFGLYNDTDRMFVKVVDREANRVVKMLPSEDFLELKQKISTAVGLIIDEEI
jgi:uncharacterized FlaG/YvyC family protein